MGLECQYTELQFYEVIEPRLVEKSTERIVGLPLQIEDITPDLDNSPRVELINILDQDIIINVTYTQVYTNGQTLEVVRWGVSYPNTLIEKNSRIKLGVGGGVVYRPGSTGYIEKSSLDYVFVDPPDVRLKNVKVRLNRTICTPCPPKNKDCINDGQPADSDAECGSGRRNVYGICIPASMPRCYDAPDGKMCCKDKLVTIGSKILGDYCDCDPECNAGLCYQEKCQYLVNPKIRCPGGTHVKRGDTFSCNLYASNTLLNKDIKLTMILEAGSGLSFSESQGCQQIEGSQCIGSSIVEDLGNRGIDVGLNANSFGDTNIEGQVTFEYGGKRVFEPVSLDFERITIYGCGNGIAEAGETKYNCCSDVPVTPHRCMAFKNEFCVGGSYIKKWTLPLISCLLR